MLIYIVIIKLYIVKWLIKLIKFIKNEVLNVCLWCGVWGNCFFENKVNMVLFIDNGFKFWWIKFVKNV